jgi:hypothetical protein
LAINGDGAAAGDYVLWIGVAEVDAEYHRGAWMVLGGRGQDGVLLAGGVTWGDLEVRASFELSYRARDHHEQRAFRVLGQVQGDFPAGELAALLDIETDQAEQILEQLVDAELVEFADADATGLVRHRLHDVLAEFAQECLARAEPEARQPPPAELLAERASPAAQTISDLQPGSAVRPGPARRPGGAEPAAQPS